MDEAEAYELHLIDVGIKKPAKISNKSAQRVIQKFRKTLDNIFTGNEQIKNIVINLAKQSYK